MATKRKGCGFLITALILLLLGGGLATFLGMSAFSSGKDFVKDIEQGHSFVTPNTTTYTAPEDSEVTVWLTGNGTEDLSKVVINVTQNRITTPANKPAGSSSMGNKQLVGTFKTVKGEIYQINATGVADGSTITVAGVSSTAALSMVGKGFGAFAVAGVGAFLAAIFGIIGLIKFFTSKSSPPPAA